MKRAENDRRRRERSLEAAMQAIAERGLSATRMSDIAAIAGMSTGHILYYFDNKTQLLVATLRWNEARMAARRAASLAELDSAVDRISHFIEVYLPNGPHDPGWRLWLEIWGKAVDDPEVAQIALEIGELWAAEIADIVRYGMQRGEFLDVDAECFALEYVAVLDGLSLHLLHLSPLSREAASAAALRIAAQWLGFSPLAAPLTS